MILIEKGDSRRERYDSTRWTKSRSLHPAFRCNVTNFVLKKHKSQLSRGKFIKRLVVLKLTFRKKRVVL
jgi:hypothetical protein